MKKIAPGSPPPKARRTAGKPAKPGATATAPAAARPAEPTPPPEESSEGNVPYTIAVQYLKGGDIQSLEIRTDDHTFYPLAQRWRYVIANRQRINESSRGGLAEEISQWLSRSTGITPGEFAERVKDIGRSGVVEIKLPFAREAAGWAARVFPWEDVVGLLTKPYRPQGSRFIVVRHLDVTGPTPTPRKPARALILRSGPGELARLYQLEPECQAIADVLQLPGYRGGDGIVREPDRDGVRKIMASLKPDIVHLSGVDPLALHAFGLAEAGSGRDGFVLAPRPGDGKAFDVIQARELAELLVPKSHPPVIVSMASCYSAQRLAALACAQGAAHAIGFQDTVTDADALVFFSTFYRVWKEGRWEILPAFDAARMEYRRQSPTGAAGVVLWSRRSLLQGEFPRTTRPQAPMKRAQQREPSVEDFRIQIKPSPRLNYSLLHNHRSPFERFLVNKRSPGRLPPLEIEVRLEVGGDACRWKTAVQLPEEAKDLVLTRDIRLPLVSGLLRECSESLRSNLHTRITCGSLLVHENSEPVTLLPVDEWRDDGVDHLWLPSFVHPRDPAVLRVILLAQRYLKALTDDYEAAFDGYQQVSEEQKDSTEAVDLQVQAIWAALQHDLNLEYINPPPSYTSQSQRLRSPTQILEGKAATCIDLALLFSSCLEYVGIYPVIFLIQGHAFPGYWRSETAWWAMRQLKSTPAAGATGPATVAAAPSRSPMVGQQEPWLFAGADNLAELISYVGNGTLAAFESTLATLGGGFHESLEQGPANLRPETFDAMVDVQLARDCDVTPLPLIQSRPQNP